MADDQGLKISFQNRSYKIEFGRFANSISKIQGRASAPITIARKPLGPYDSLRIDIENLRQHDLLFQSSIYDSFLLIPSTHLPLDQVLKFRNQRALKNIFPWTSPLFKNELVQKLSEENDPQWFHKGFAKSFAVIAKQTNPLFCGELHFKNSLLDHNHIEVCFYLMDLFFALKNKKELIVDMNQFLFHSLKKQKVFCQVLVKQKPLTELLLQNGFEIEATLRQSFPSEGKWVDENYMSCINPIDLELLDP